MLYSNNSIKLNVQLSTELDRMTNIQYLQITDLNENLFQDKSVSADTNRSP
jgi:hypothetical protein